MYYTTLALHQIKTINQQWTSRRTFPPTSLSVFHLLDLSLSHSLLSTSVLWLLSTALSALLYFVSWLFCFFPSLRIIWSCSYLWALLQDFPSYDSLVLLNFLSHAHVSCHTLLLRGWYQYRARFHVLQNCSTICCKPQAYSS